MLEYRDGGEGFGLRREMVADDAEADFCPCGRSPWEDTINRTTAIFQCKLDNIRPLCVDIAQVCRGKVQRDKVSNLREK